jgi:hypothetical protein
MRETRDLGFALIGATLLLLGASYLAQCRSADHGPSSAGDTEAAPASAGTTATPQGEKTDTSEQRKSAREMAEEEEKEERERIKNVAHALQTIAANPAARKTYGFPPAQPRSGNR